MLSLCLSRACLGKLIRLVYKVHGNTVVLPRSRLRPDLWRSVHESVAFLCCAPDHAMVKFVPESALSHTTRAIRFDLYINVMMIQSIIQFQFPYLSAPPRPARVRSVDMIERKVPAPVIISVTS